MDENSKVSQVSGTHSDNAAGFVHPIKFMRCVFPDESLSVRLSTFTSDVSFGIDTESMIGTWYSLGRRLLQGSPMNRPLNSLLNDEPGRGFPFVEDFGFIEFPKHLNL